jgi:autotransporter-associated beta strand protein
MKGSIDGGAELFKTGAGPYTISADGTHKFKSLSVEKGQMNLARNADDSAYQVTNHWYVTGTDCTGEYVARLNLGEGVRTYSETARDVGSIALGFSKKPAEGGSQAGILTIGDGAVLSNEFRIGWDQSGGWHTGGMGAVYMGNATVYWKGGTSNDGFLGNNDWGYGYFCQNNGAFSHRGYFNLGATGHGCFDQRGGTHKVETSDPLKMARSGWMSWACYHQTGGTFDGKAVWFNHVNNTNSTRATAVITTSGTNSLFRSTQMIADMSRGGVDTFINVNDGATLQGRLFRQIRFSGYNAANWTALATEMDATTRLYLNLNGGILKNADRTDANLWGNDRLRGPTRATVYEKGVTLDTSDGDITLFTELVKPFGKGVRSIAVPSAVAGSNVYISSPRVKITSGTGSGAVAYAVFNEKTRSVERIEISSPGCGYEEASVAIENYTMAEGRDIAATSVELAVLSTTGGVRKVGSGTLTLKCANTYGGVTRVEGGTIAFTDAAGLPQNSALEFSAAVVSGSDKTTPILTAVNYNGGEVRITEAETLDLNTFGRSQALLKFTNAPASLPTLKLVRSDGTEMPVTSWKLFFKADRTIMFGRDNGLIISIH